MNPSKTAVIADSGCDVPQMFRDKYDIRLLPFHIIYPERDYLDSVDIDPRMIYKRFPDEFPSTSTPSISEVNDVIDRLNELRRALNESGTRPYQLHISFGSSAFVPEHDRPDDVFRRVDQEMYKQKRIRHSRRKKLHENNLSGR